MKKDFLYKAAEKIFDKYICRDKSGRLFSEQVREQMRTFYPVEAENRTRLYYIEKIRLCLLAGFAGMIFTGLLFFSERQQQPVMENRIQREGYEGKVREVPVRVTVAEEEEELVLQVRERLYTQEQLKGLYNRATGKLEKEIMGENKTLEYVDKNLKLINRLPGYPFQIEWECQNYEFLNTDGELRTENIPQEGAAVGLNAVFTYEDFRAEYLFYIKVYPVLLTPSEQRKQALLAAVERADKISQNSEALELPASLDGKTLVWKNRTDMTWAVVPILAACVVVSIYFFKDRDLKKKMEEREIRMKLEYPEFVSKLSIYLGAGMTIRSAWEKLAGDYVRKKEKGGEKSYLYEEIGIASQEMKSGISEPAAYDRFGKRSRSQLYLKFSTLLVQNLMKGSNGLGKLLKEESRLAFEERKNMARKLGEEAGTKLLLPMILMLCVVMIIIMVPAFMTF